MRLLQIEIAHQQVVERLHHQRCRKLGRQHIAGNALDTVGGQQGIAGVACQRRALVAGDEDDRCAVLLGGTGGRLQRLAAACAGNEQQGIFGVSAEAKDRAFSGTGLIMQRLPRLPSLSEASIATGRLLPLASISMISAARRMESTFLSWTRFKA